MKLIIVFMVLSFLILGCATGHKRCVETRTIYMPMRICSQYSKWGDCLSYVMITTTSTPCVKWECEQGYEADDKGKCVPVGEIKKAGDEIKHYTERGDTAGVNANLDVKAGKKIYDAECAVCHGKTGAGDGPASTPLKPKPTDFTDKAKLSKSNDKLFKSISDGIKNTAMPSYANKLSEEDRQVVIAYIRTFGISAYGQEGVGTDIPIAQPAKSTPSQTTTPSQTKDLIESTMSGNTARIKALLKMGADVNAKNKDGGTVLMVASMYGRTEIVKVLIDKGADVNAKNENGTTVLMWASGNGHDKVVAMLLDKGADVNAKDKDGATALMWASEKGRTEIVQLLKEAGAKE